jgi:hypothetical protein
MAQNYYKIFDVRYEYSPGNKYKADPSNTVDIEETNSNLNLPLPRENGDAILLGIGMNTLKMYPNLTAADNSIDTAFSHNHTYFRYRAQLGYKKKVNDDLDIVGMGMFRISSDMLDVSSDDYQYGGLILVSKRKSEKLILKYGLYVNTEFFGLFVIPLIGTDWKFNDKIRIYGILPSNLTIERTYSRCFRAGLIFEAPTFTYRLSDKDVNTINSQEQISTYVQNTKNALYIYTDFYLTKSIAIQVRVGYSVFRRIRLFDSEEVSRLNIYGADFGGLRVPILDVPAYQKFSDGMLLNANISYRFKLE